MLQRAKHSRMVWVDESIVAADTGGKTRGSSTRTALKAVIPRLTLGYLVIVICPPQRHVLTSHDFAQHAPTKC